MISKEVQESLLETVQFLVGERLKSVNFTEALIGLVEEIANITTAMVNIYEDLHECTIPHLLANRVTVGDVVVVHQVSNSLKVVQGVISRAEGSNILHIWDSETGEVISTRFHIYDDVTGEIIDALIGISEEV